MSDDSFFKNVIEDEMTIANTGWHLYTHTSEGFRFISYDNDVVWDMLPKEQKRRMIALLIEDIGPEGVADKILAGAVLDDFINDAKFYLDCQPLYDAMVDNDFHLLHKDDVVGYVYREASE